MEEKKNFKKKNFRNNKKTDKFSMKKQMERKHQPIPCSVEEWRGKRGLIEYTMSQNMAETILETRKGKDKGVDPQNWLCDYVNDELRFIGYCIKVIVA